jgi:putative nucleotidyltransferase with HDIG domain
MGYSQEEIHRLEKAAILHDIGKVATPDAILLKPGKLSLLEYELIKQHSEVGADMLQRITIYKDLANIIRYHHSRYDGKGYPKTASPDEIPMLSHIMVVADSFDAMTTNRIYKPRKTISEALEELQDNSGTQFHPKVVAIALVALKDVVLSDSGQLPTSELEQRRMSYFFKDALTGLYNENYLQTVLNAPDHPYISLNIIDLKRFTTYNKKYGWEKGNDLLRNFANFLKTSFPEHLIIRHHGDDFIMLSKTVQKINVRELEFTELHNTRVRIYGTHYDIDNYFNFEVCVFENSDI